MPSQSGMDWTRMNEGLLFSWDDFKIVIIAMLLSNIVGIIKMPLKAIARMWLIKNFSDGNLVITEYDVPRIWHDIYKNSSCATDRFMLRYSLSYGHGRRNTRNI
jgi:hypothetical protein